MCSMKTVVGVIRGGRSNEYDSSLATGNTVLENLSNEKYLTVDIFIDKDGIWHVSGKPIEPFKILRQVDVVYNCLHGEYGEDGEVQKLFEMHGVPFVGSDSFASFISMHKIFSKDKAISLGINTPKYTLIEAEDDVEEKVCEIVRTYMQPVIVKPVFGGSSIGVSVVGGYVPVYNSVVSLIASGAKGVFVEEFVRGREVSVSVVDGLRGERLYAAPVIEITTPEKEDHFSYEIKRDNLAQKTCPAHLPSEVSGELTQYAREMHKALNLRHYSRSDFIVSQNGIYYIETNSLPGLSSSSLLPESLSSVGVSMSEFLEHVVTLARN